MSKDHFKRPKSTSPKEDDRAFPLLFINKNASNLATTAEEVHAIGSHASKVSRKWKRVNPYLDLDSSTSRILAGHDLSGDQSSVTTAASTNRGLSLKWRVSDGRTTSTKRPGTKDCEKPSDEATRRLASSSTSSRINPATCPLQSLDEGFRSKISRLLDTYRHRVQPALSTISDSWVWVDDLSFVQSSQALMYSICAFTSALTTGLQHGLHKLCLPPEEQETQGPSWPVPDWFLFQARTISLLREHLATTNDPARVVHKAELHAILFLMRLQIMLGNQNAALIHMQAIQRLTENAVVAPDLNIELAMWKVNFVLALKYPAAIRTEAYVPAADQLQQEPLLEIDLHLIPDQIERMNVHRLLLDRISLWREQCPSNVAFTSETLIEDHLTIDRDYQNLGDEDAQEIRHCLLISRHLLAYLRYLDAGTWLGSIRHLVFDLQERLTHLLVPEKTENLWSNVPRVLLYLLYAGAFASRGFEIERLWFSHQLRYGKSLGVFQSFNDVKAILASFLSLETVQGGLLEDVWNDVITRQKVGAW